jgi:ABC-type sugar transport system ATPase subunit
MPPIIELKGITKAFAGSEVLTDLDLSIQKDDFMVIYGLPSSGKSVLLRLLMGLEKPDSGKIHLRGRDVSRRPPKERNLGYVPQDFALFPQKSIFENIAYPLRVTRRAEAEVSQTVQRAADMLNIEDLLQKLPTQLSGGQKQRVAIARGIVKETDIYVFDDPLAGLDFKLREKLFDDLKMLQEQLGATFIYTTSDPVESMSLAATVAVLHERRVQEVGAPESIYLNPGRLSTMEIFGFPTANLISGRVSSEAGELRCKTDLFTFQVAPDGVDVPPMADGLEVTVGIRSENIKPSTKGSAATLPAKVYLREDLGAEEIIYLEVRGIEWTMVQTNVDSRANELEESIGIDVISDALFVFNSEDGRRIGRGKGKLNV